MGAASGREVPWGWWRARWPDAVRADRLTPGSCREVRWKDRGIAMQALWRDRLSAGRHANLRFGRVRKPKPQGAVIHHAWQCRRAAVHRIVQDMREIEVAERSRQMAHRPLIAIDDVPREWDPSSLYCRATRSALLMTGSRVGDKEEVGAVSRVLCCSHEPRHVPARPFPASRKLPGRAPAKVSGSTTTRAPGNRDRSTVRRIIVAFPVMGFSRSAIASGHCRPGRPCVPRSVMGVS